MKLIVGLGNPGRKYAGTRHNVGYDVIADLVKRTSAGTSKLRFESEMWEANIAGEKTLLACPITYMNLSGRAIQQILAFYKLAPADLVVICDDLNLPAGKLRLRKSGTAGGQKGLQNTIDMLGTTEFARLRIGIDRPPGQMDAAAYVLAKVRPEEAEVLESAVWKAADAVESIVKIGVDLTMNTVNAGA
ncbi:Peptidyl-tRNA hydrolase [Caulifigura coniformis]|uniref:Peptidyl-tRNA hydrolase n=1 Tax=Caulifigura coniformis TaxID=2527983 RepID=A0A517SN28_9PLAN|nr:aminoacyl-tRNA hydrolase [Caulifigura coniformis]QDT57506.1 Peptidyl-tRNA hydrolase [Caulifigura coniformis]